jgi:hypothetical protein
MRKTLGMAVIVLGMLFGVVGSDRTETEAKAQEAAPADNAGHKELRNPRGT